MGTRWWPKSATGCALSCLIGAAIAVGENKLLSTASIIAIYGLAGEMAAKTAKGPGSLRMHLLDNLANIAPSEVSENVNIKNAWLYYLFCCWPWKYFIKSYIK